MWVWVGDGAREREATYRGDFFGEREEEEKENNLAQGHAGIIPLGHTTLVSTLVHSSSPF